MTCGLGHKCSPDQVTLVDIDMDLIHITDHLGSPHTGHTIAEDERRSIKRLFTLLVRTVNSVDSI